MPPGRTTSDNSGAQRAKLIKKLSIELEKFNRDELKSVVVPYLGNYTWTDIKNALVKRKMTIDAPSIVTVIDNFLKKNNVNNDAIKDMIYKIQLVEISRHSAKKVWHTYEMKTRIQSNVDDINDAHDLHAEIKERLRKNNIKAKCLVECYGEMFFVLFGQTPTTKQKTLLQAPVVFATTLNGNNFFCTKKTVNNDFKTVLTETLGYKNNKVVRLRGKDLATLCQLLQNKKSGVVQKREEDVPENAEPIVNEHGIDYTQHAHRKDFLRKSMGGERCQLESVRFDCADVPVEVPPSLASLGIDLSGLKLDVGWEFQSQNVFKLLPSLAENAQLMHPTPDYLINFMTSGRNELQYKNAE